MIEQLFLIIAMVVLGKASEHDYKTKYVKLSTPLLILLCGVLYMMFAENSIIDTIGIVIFTGFIFALPSLFNFGLGDFFIFLGLAFFFGTENAFFLFLSIFLIVWILWTVYYFKKLDKSNKKIWKVEYPLVPAITFSFYGWIMLRLII